MIFNEPDASELSWCEHYTVQNCLKDSLPFKKCLSICCGFGQVERTLARYQVAEKIVGTDIASGAIEEAKKRAEAEKLDNIDYYVADLNTEELPFQEYDLIWANGALHHIADLERVIPKLHQSMKVDGVLVSNEYVGPKYQQIGTRQQELVNAVKHLLPPELRGKDICRWPYGDSLAKKALRYASRIPERMRPDGIYDVLWRRRSEAFFLASDPSECVGSDRIIPTLKKYFDQVEIRYFNGSLLFYALDQNFFDNFDSANSKHVATLQMLFDLEDALVAAGEIGHDHAHIICRKTREKGPC